MTEHKKPRLRYFESSPGQRHIGDDDKYLYRRPEPSHRINVIGTGTIGQEHMRVAHLLGRLAVHGIYDDHARSVDVARENHAMYCDDELVTYDSLDAACNDPAVDALLICTPNHTHLDVLEVASRSGKPIFLEKPMATTLPDARRIVEIADSYPTFIQVGLQYRYKAPYVEARHEALDRGTLGEIRTISMSEYRPPFLDKVGQWNKYNAKSGGTLVEKCCHYFDLLSLFARGRPQRVFATSGQAVNFRDFERDGVASDIDDHAFAIVEYDNDVRASFTLNMFAPHFYEELVIGGEHGRLVATERFDFLTDDRARSSLNVELCERGASRQTDVGYAEIIEKSGHHGATYFEHIAFADRLDGKPSDAATPIEGLWSIVVATAAQVSAASGQPVDVEDLIKEHKLGAMLSD